MYWYRQLHLYVVLLLGDAKTLLIDLVSYGVGGGNLLDALFFFGDG